MKYKNSALKITLWIISVFIFVIPFCLIYKRYASIEHDKEHTYQEFVTPAEKTDDSVQSFSNGSVATSKVDKPLPEKIMIDVPFTTQAPMVNWDALHEEACEEASLLMVNYFLNNKNLGSSSDVESQILNMVNYENTHEYKADVTTDELNKIAKDYLGMKTGRVMANFSITDLKKELASGRPVIVPAAGKLLQNPNFRGGGPVYHMLVIKGYDKDGFITNDPGTRNGNGYKYDFNLLFDAIHNWNKENILNGPKSYLVFDR